MTRAETWAASYFQAEGTVSRWWDPLSPSDRAFRDWYVDQQTDLLQIADVTGRDVVDAATGRGRMAIACSHAGASSVRAVDISQEMLDQARASAESAGARNIEFVQAELTNIGLDTGTADVVFLLEVLLHLEQPIDVLSEMRRVLRPNGRLVITTNGANPISRLLQPAKGGATPASKLKLASAAGINALMTMAFGFTWQRTRLTGALYRRAYNAPVRPLSPPLVRKMLAAAGFHSVYHRAVGPTTLPREHRWVALA